MKILTLGDIHGRDCWIKIIEIENPDLVIFLGDYVSTHGLITEKEQIENLENILKYKEENTEKVILLRGNHDMEALNYWWAECYPDTGDTVKKYMEKNKERFLNNTQWIYIYNNLLFSHAGISSVWLSNNNINSLEEINTLSPSEIFGFTPSKMSDYTGDSPTQPPTWIRPFRLVECGVKGYSHIVGHTTVRFKITNIKEEYKKLNLNPSIIDDLVDVYCCDALPNQYLVIDNGEFKIKDVDYE